VESRKEENIMAEQKHEQRFVWVKDKAGNEFVCRVMDLKDPKKVDEKDLKNCLDDAARAINVGD
jgi:hypothetical protein